jgi:hypothetical protein
MVEGLVNDLLTGRGEHNRLRRKSGRKLAEKAVAGTWHSLA